MKRRKPVLPEYPDRATLEQAARRALDLDEDVENLLFEDDVLEGLEGTSLTFSGCVFRRVRFGENDFSHLNLLDCRLDHCDFSGFRLPEGSMHRVEALQCRGMGAQLDRSVLRDVLFDQCRLGYLTVSECRLLQTAFADCELENLLLYGCQLKDAAFERCRMTAAEVTGTSLAGVDLSTDDISGLKAQLECLKGAEISVVQAPELCALMGLVIR